jgi:hypothetical protein
MSERRDESEHLADELAAEIGLHREEAAPAEEMSADERLLMARFAGEVRENAIPVTINVGWEVAWALLATIQLACRNEAFTGPTRNVAEGFGRHLEKQIALGPASAQIAAMGWEKHYDAPIAPNEDDDGSAEARS